MKALIVEDSTEVQETVSLCLRMRWPNCEAIAVTRGRQAIEVVEQQSPDVIILDLGLPDMDGLDVLREVRQFSSVPVLILTLRNDEISRVKGLEIGADDYVMKPFFHTELLARVKAVLRRSGMPEFWDDLGVVKGPNFSADLTRRQLLVNDTTVHLTPLQWNLLTYLARNPGRVMSYQVLAEKVWGAEEVDPTTIKMAVHRLRVKLEDTSQKAPVIRALRGVGYSFTLLQ